MKTKINRLPKIVKEQAISRHGCVGTCVLFEISKPQGG